MKFETTTVGIVFIPFYFSNICKPVLFFKKKLLNCVRMTKQHVFPSLQAI